MIFEIRSPFLSTLRLMHYFPVAGEEVACHRPLNLGKGRSRRTLSPPHPHPRRRRPTSSIKIKKKRKKQWILVLITILVKRVEKCKLSLYYY